MKKLITLILPFVCVSTMAQEPLKMKVPIFDSDDITLKNAELGELLRSSKAEIDNENPNYSLVIDNLEEAKALCYALKCRANKITCSEIYKTSGLVSYLQYAWVPTVAEIQKKYTKEKVVMLRK